MPRVPGASKLVSECAKEDGIDATYGTEITGTDENGRALASDGKVLGRPGARVFWATGYTPNSGYFHDPRTDRAIAERLDKGGFVQVTKTMQLNDSDLSHIFAGGDICERSAFTAGERTAAAASGHAFTIVKNICSMAGARDIGMKRPSINTTAGLEGLVVSLGNKRGLVFATDPTLEPFFADAEKHKAERGPLAEAGPNGWIEVSTACEHVKFEMVPEGYKKMLVEGDMALIDMFYGVDQTGKVIDA